METIKKNDRVTNILYVDNDRFLVNDLKDWIKKAEIENRHQLRFTFVPDAKSALKKLAEMDIGMVILEIALPLVSGYHLISAIRNTRKELPVVIYTNLKNPQDLAKMASAKVDNIFLKDLMSMQDMVEIIGQKGSAKNIDALVMELSSQIKTLHSAENKSELKLIQCPQCHMILAPDSHFCNNCGQKIFRKSKKILTTEESGHAETKKTSKTQ